jgi:L-galactono-1,4-lactone dehydrogenase
MSPAHSEGADDLHSWVGIIMYMPTDDAPQRQAITEAFARYNDAVRWRLWPKYGCHQHWAKVELPATGAADAARAKARLHERFPIAEFNAARAQLDPASIMTNRQLDELLSPP